MRAAVALMMGMLCCWCSGCAAQGPEIVPGELAERLLEELSFSDQLLEADRELVENYYGALDGVESFSVWMSSGGTVEEIAVLRLNNPQDLPGALEALGRRMERQRQTYADYLPEELPKLDSCVLQGAGNLALLVVSGDPQAEEIVQTLIAG